MNKLLLKPQLSFSENGIYYLDGDCSLPIDLSILPNVDCTILLKSDGLKQNIRIHIGENAHVLYQTFGKNRSSDIQIFLEGYKAQIEFIYSMIVDKTCGLNVQVFHQAAHTKSVLYNSIVNYGKHSTSIRVDAHVAKGIVGCHLHQDNRIILIHDGEGKILPNLWIDEFDCFAEHSAYISKFQKNDLFYLMSRGIRIEDAYFLLTKSLLLGKMQLDEESQASYVEMIQNMGR